MRYFLLGVILVLVCVTPVRADGDLTAAVTDQWGWRYVSETLHTIAHQRVIEISRCSTCMDHDLMRIGTAEVLGWNAGYTNPIAQVIRSWANSPVHDAILSDPSLRRIGCAKRVVSGKHYFVCVLR